MCSPPQYCIITRATLALPINPSFSILTAICFYARLRIYRIVRVVKDKCNIAIYLRRRKIISPFILRYWAQIAILINHSNFTACVITGCKSTVI